MEFKELKNEVINWGIQRGIIKPENHLKQFAKFISEAGELGDALIKDDEPGIIDGLGDVLVTLIILSEQKGFDLTDCLESAYNEIKDRTGKTVGGVFIKEDSNESPLIEDWIKTFKGNEMSVRLYNILKDAVVYNGRNLSTGNAKWRNISTFSLDHLTWEKMRKVRNFGKKSWDEFVKLRGY